MAQKKDKKGKTAPGSCPPAFRANDPSGGNVAPENTGQGSAPGSRDQGKTSRKHH